MTWYADEILIPATAAATIRVAADPGLKSFAYVVTDIADFAWHNDEVRHGLPQEGLIVIRPVLADAEGSWFQEPALPWATFASSSSDPLDAGITTRLEQYLGDDPVPPPAFRRCLAALSKELGTPVVYYAAIMWGGDIESEYCLNYLPHEELVLTRGSRNDVDDFRIDSLRIGLTHLGLSLPTGFFALHTRSFPWERYKLD